MSDAPNDLRGKREPGPEAQRPAAFTPRPPGVSGGSGTLRPPGASGARLRPPTTGPSRRPGDDVDGPAALVGEDGDDADEEGWDDDTVAINPTPGSSVSVSVAPRAPTAPVIDVPAGRASPGPGPGRPSPSPTNTHPRSQPTVREGRPVGTLATSPRAEATPIPGRVGESVRPAPPYRGPLGSSSSSSFVPAPLQHTAPSSSMTPAPPATEARLSEAALQKVLDDVRFATERAVPRLVENQLADVLKAQREIVNRLDRLEAMVRLAQSTADEAVSLVPAQPAARPAPARQAAPAPVQVPAEPFPQAAPLALGPAAGSLAPVITDATPAMSSAPQPESPIAAPARPALSYVPPASPSLDVEIPSELVGKKGKGVWFFLILALLILGAFGAMVVSSNLS
jgi:hypothetical protein